MVVEEVEEEGRGGESKEMSSPCSFEGEETEDELADSSARFFAFLFSFFARGDFGVSFVVGSFSFVSFTFVDFVDFAGFVVVVVGGGGALPVQGTPAEG